MPVPVAAIPIIAQAMNYTKIADTASNLLQGAAVLVDWAKAQEGLKYNPHVFEIPITTAKEENKKQPASAATPNRTNPNGLIKKTILTIQTSSSLLLQTDAGKLVFGIALRKSSGVFQNGQVILISSYGFATSLGDQAELEFSGVSWGTLGYLLTFQGQINPLAHNFARINGAVLITSQGTIKPQGFWDAVPADPEEPKWNDGEGYQLKL